MPIERAKTVIVRCDNCNAEEIVIMPEDTYEYQYAKDILRGKNWVFVERITRNNVISCPDCAQFLPD